MAKLLMWSIKDIVECIDKMQEAEFDCIICIEGKRGLGKSTLAYKIASRLKSKFNPHKDLCYSRRQVLKALATKILGIIFADEMINVAFNRDFYIEDQKQLIKGLNMYRDSFNVFLLCIKNMANLDTQLQGLIKLRLTIVRRGIALVQMQVPSIYSNDPWDIKNNQRIETSWNKKGIKNPRYVQLTTVRGMLKFNDLNEKTKELYKKIKHDKRNRIFEKEAELELEQDPTTIFYKNLLVRLKTKELTKESFSEICNVSGKTETIVRHRLNSLLRDDNLKERVQELLLKGTNKTIGKREGGVLGLRGVSA